mgnify:CR=1 FL=1
MIENITYERVIESGNELSKSAANLKDILAEVEQRMQRVNTSDTWKSDSAERLYVKFKALSTKFEAFYTAVETYSKFLHNTVNTYQQAEQAISKEADEVLTDGTASV